MALEKAKTLRIIHLETCSSLRHHVTWLVPPRFSYLNLLGINQLSGYKRIVTLIIVSILVSHTRRDVQLLSLWALSLFFFFKFMKSSIMISIIVLLRRHKLICWRGHNLAVLLGRIKYIQIHYRITCENHSFLLRKIIFLKICLQIANCKLQYMRYVFYRTLIIKFTEIYAGNRCFIIIVEYFILISNWLLQARKEIKFIWWIPESAFEYVFLCRKYDKNILFFNIIVWNNNLIILSIKMHVFCLFKKN